MFEIDGVAFSRSELDDNIVIVVPSFNSHFFIENHLSKWTCGIKCNIHEKERHKKWKKRSWKDEETEKC